MNSKGNIKVSASFESIEEEIEDETEIVSDFEEEIETDESDDSDFEEKESKEKLPPLKEVRSLSFVQ